MTQTGMVKAEAPETPVGALALKYDMTPEELKSTLKGTIMQGNPTRS